MLCGHSFSTAFCTQPSRFFSLSLVIVLMVTSDLPLQSSSSNTRLNHLSGLRLPNPDFSILGKVHLLHVETYVEQSQSGFEFHSCICQSPLRLRLAVCLPTMSPHSSCCCEHVSQLTGDDLIWRSWRLKRDLHRTTHWALKNVLSWNTSRLTTLTYQMVDLLYHCLRNKSLGEWHRQCIDFCQSNVLSMQRTNLRSSKIWLMSTLKLVTLERSPMISVLPSDLLCSHKN